MILFCSSYIYMMIECEGFQIIRMAVLVSWDKETVVALKNIEDLKNSLLLV